MEYFYLHLSAAAFFLLRHTLNPPLETDYTD